MKTETPMQTVLRHVSEMISKYEKNAMEAKSSDGYSINKHCQHDLEQLKEEIKKILPKN